MNDNVSYNSEFGKMTHLVTNPTIHQPAQLSWAESLYGPEIDKT